MTKTELLTNLAALPFVSKLNGDPVDVTPPDDPHKWYRQNYTELVGGAGIKRDCKFQVASEGVAGKEVAFWMDRGPVQTVQPTDFRIWLEAELVKLVTAGTVLGYAFGTIDEVSDFAVVAMVMPNAAKADLKAFLCKKDAGGKLLRIEMTLTTTDVVRMFQNKL